jgi:hypothetical protein
MKSRLESQVAAKHIEKNMISRRDGIEIGIENFCSWDEVAGLPTTAKMS